MYERIERTIRQRIRAGVYRVNTAIPTEMELCREFHTSRLTVAKGLSGLIAAGVLERIRGRGTFVRGNSVPESGLRPGPGQGGVISYVSALSDMRKLPDRPALLEGMAEVLDREGYSTGVKFYGSVEDEIRILQSFEQPINAGFVIWSAMDERILPVLQKMREAKFPFVLVDAAFPQFPSDCIGNDNMIGAEILVRHLHEQGHSRIAYLSVPLIRQSICERMTGMLSALGQRGIFRTEYLGIIPERNPVNVEYFAAHNHQFILEYLTHLLALPEAPTAIICSNDILAGSVLDTLAAMRIAVPGQISVAGMDNTDAAIRAAIPLSSVAPDFHGMGVRAARLLLERIAGSPDIPLRDPCRVQLPPTLVVRDSTGPAAGK